MDTVKRYFVSSVISFISAFGLVFLPLVDKALEMGDINRTVLISASIAGGYAGLRALIKVWYEVVRGLR